MPSGRPRKITKGVIDYTSADQRLIYKCEEAIHELNEKIYLLEKRLEDSEIRFNNLKAEFLTMLRKADTVLRPSDAASYLNVSLGTLRRYVKECRLKPIRYNFSGRKCGYGYSRFALDKINLDALNMVDEGGNEQAYDFMIEPPSNKIVKAVRNSIAREKRERKERLNRARMARMVKKETNI